ncbi:MaoC family dehydratase [Halopelagius longus]|uniref:Acyl dehydratase n=1 Tax=Halopelagius longus TaxID=1236180 RepID=A0A1H1FME2_9EURY|nr:MaoC family dehydratase [Halopelagius longus]RDI70046.1 acyl dehydratase [Halopelagius longus]SDR01696.1 Acyl dehydratase [Halopelagius longus]
MARDDRTGDRVSPPPLGGQFEEFTTAWGRASNHLVNSVVEANRATLALFGVNGHDADGDAEAVAVSHSEEEWEFERSVDAVEDIDVGDWVRFSKSIDEADVTAFAAASGDTNRLHTDEEFASRTRFGGRIVHGTLVSGLISAALARLPGLTIYLSQEMEFVGPAEVGSRLTAMVEVTERLGSDRFRLSTDVLGDDENPVVEGEAVVLIDSIPEDDEPPSSGGGRA